MGCSDAGTGWKHSAGITQDGRLLMWGWNGAYNEDSWLMVG